MTHQHQAHLESDLLHGWRVRCDCGFVSLWMGEGDAWTTKERGLVDVGHAAFARKLPKTGGGDPAGE